MIDKNTNFDEIDNILFSYFDNNKDIPLSTQETIYKAFDIPAKPITLIYKIQKIAVILITFIILTTGVVFAKDIISFITSLFTNTTEGINKAVENGYVQNVNMDFVYDNDIGIKVDYLVMDDSNLDVSFVYDTKNYSKVSSISLNEYIIRDENNNVIYYYFEDENKMNKAQCTANFHIRTNEQMLNVANKFHESILYTSQKFSKSKNLIFEIYSYNINDTILKGCWIFNINLEDKIVERKNDSYIASYNTYIENISTELTETSLIIDIKLNSELNNDILLENDNIILTNTSNKSFEYIKLKSNNFTDNTSSNYKSEIYLVYDEICKYYNNTCNLNLHLKIAEDKIIDIQLIK